MDPLPLQPALQLYRADAARSVLSNGSYARMYSVWKSVDNYDTCAWIFVVLFNGFVTQVTLTLCTDIKITETTYSYQFQYVFGNQ